MRTLSKIYRTKSEAKEAIKRGEVLHVTTHEGKPLPTAIGGPYLITCQLAHYKAWQAEVYADGQRVTRIK